MDVVLMPRLVAVTDSPAGDDLSVERAVLAPFHVEKVSWHDLPSLIEALQDADAIMCMHAPLNETVVRSLSHCRIIARFGTGLDNIDRATAQSVNIAVAGVEDYCTQDVANHTLALLLAWSRKVVEYHQFVSEKRWNERHQTTGNWGCGPVVRLSTQVLGLWGFGRVGRAVAHRAVAFGMKVLAHTRHPDPILVQGLGVELVSRDDLLKRADFISLHLPLTQETRHLINSETLRQMKRGAVLINTARGGLVDEEALAEALGSGHLGGALLELRRRTAEAVLQHLGGA
jgi:D-3-phosphoglycerate dehydrogenase